MLESVLKQAATGTAEKFKPRKTDCTAHFTPGQVAGRWGWHVESVRRAIRQRRITAIIISRRLLVPVAEVERIEAEGRIARAE